MLPKRGSVLSLTDSCRLPVAKQRLRAAEFEALFAGSLIGLEWIAPTQLSMRLAGSEGLLDWVRDLTERESACCSFFTFTLTPADDGAVRLDVGGGPTRAGCCAGGGGSPGSPWPADHERRPAPTAAVRSATPRALG